MARDTDSLLVRKWAATSTLVQTPEAAGLTRATGLPASYGTTDFLALEVFNQLWREITGAAVEVGQHGILPWHTGQSYPHDPISLVIGSDGELYKSVQASGGSLTSQDPTTDSSDTYWEAFAISVPNSSTTTRGIIRTATAAEARTGTATSPAVTPAGLTAAIAAAAPPSGDGDHVVTAAGTTTFVWPWAATRARVVTQGGGGGGGGGADFGILGGLGTAGSESSVAVNTETIEAEGGEGGFRGEDSGSSNEMGWVIASVGNAGDGGLGTALRRNGMSGFSGEVVVGELTGLSVGDQLSIIVGDGGPGGTMGGNANAGSAGAAGRVVIVPVY